MHPPRLKQIAVENGDLREQPGGQARQALAAAIRGHADAVAALERAMAARKRLGDAEVDELAIMGEITALSGAEAEAMRRWAETGEGDRPAPRTDERRALADRFAAAQATAAAARANAPSGDLQILAAQQGIARARRGVALAIVPVLEEEIAPLFERLRQVSDERRMLAAQILGLPELLFANGRARNSAGDHDGARPFAIAGERLTNETAVTTAEPSRADVEAAARAWAAFSARLEADPNATLAESHS